MEKVQQQISNWDKFRLLMWKNYLLQWRHKVQTIIEIIVPIMFCLGILIVRSLVVPTEVNNATYYEPIINDDAVNPPFRSPTYFDIGFTPINMAFEELMVAVCDDIFYCRHPISVQNEHELEALIDDHSLNVGIVFHHPANITQLPSNLEYSLIFPSEWGFSPEFFYNWQTNSLFSIFSNDGPGQEIRNETGFPTYFQQEWASFHQTIAYRFSFLQCDNIDRDNGTAERCGWEDKAEFPYVTFQRFPSPPHSFGNFLELLQIFVSFCIILSFIYPTMNTVRFIVMEKEKQFKEVMQMMGVSSLIQWISWFVRTMILMIIIISIMVGLLKISVLVHSDFTTIWAFLFIYSISMITYCFMLSVFFSKANYAAAVAGLVWIISYIPISLIYERRSEEMFIASIIIASLCANTEMGYGVQIILRFEETGEGLQWSNFLEPATNDDDISIGIIIAFMLMTSCVYLLVALFLEKIYPRAFAIVKKWCLPFAKKVRCCGKDNAKNEDHSEVPINNNRNDVDFEADSENSLVTVIIENLRKSFGKTKDANRGLSLNLFENQITILIGSGKTTIISMLTGILPPTTGEAIIDGNNVHKNQKARHCIGFCPQQNMLYDELTVCEHLIVFSRLKGMSNENGKQEVEKYIELLKLEPQMNDLPSSLSRGSLRKLSVGLALCAYSKVVFLDEPSSEMDPIDRRVLWDVLQSEKNCRTILLTTNSMNEADMLGDRIAVIEDGELKCYGTSLFLKRRLDVEYNLICVKDADCNPIWVTLTLRNFIPRIKLKSEIGTKLTYVLPNGQQYRFEKILKYLETDGKRLKLRSFGIWLSEDVDFSNVSSDLKKPKEMSSTSRLQNDNTLKNFYEVSPLRGLRLQFCQWHAMLKKKCIFWYRNWILFLLQFLISVAFIVIGIAIYHMIDTQIEPCDVSLDFYKKSVIMLQNDNLSVARLYNYTGIKSSYREIIQERYTAHIVDEFDEDIQTRFLRLVKTGRLNLGWDSQYLVGMSPGNDETVTAWFNQQPFNTVPLTISLIYNAIFRSKYGSNYTISLRQEPRPFTIKSRINNLLAGKNLGFQLATLISFAMAFVSALYAIYYIKERVSKIKQLQFISGVRVLTFWLTSFLFDYLTYILIVIVMGLTIYTFEEENWSTFDELLPAFVILVVFGFAILPITYVLSWFFSIATSAIVGLTIIYSFTGTILFFVVAMSSLPSIAGTMDPFKDYLIIFPHYSLSTSLNNLNLMNMVKRLCKIKCSQLSVDVCDKEKLCLLEENCCERDYYALNEPGIGLNLICMFANGVIFFTVLLLAECRFFQYAACFTRNIFFKPSLEPQSEEEYFVDDNVEDEKRKVDAMSPFDLKVNNLVLQNVSKIYGKSMAVDDVSIGIQQSECFGLFGINGCGKSTIFEILTGGTKISSGEAFVRGISLKRNMSNVRKMIGYCPQSDPLFKDLTGRETLEIFALLRGIRMKDIKNSINFLANDLNFMQQIDQYISKYSTANKRKLSVAVAFIGNPDIVYFDEPTKGMDPDSRRSLLNLIAKVCNYGKSIVLASNNLDDDHAVCSRIAIMIKGKLRYLGSTEDLRDRFSEGFLLTVKVSSQDVKDDIERNFPAAELKKDSENLLTYYVPPEREFKGSRYFALMQKMKKSHLIEDYAIYRPSLEQSLPSFT